MQEVQVRQPLSVRGRLAALTQSQAAVHLGAVALLMLGCALFFAYLLRRFSYDGLYGQDSYAYYYQSRALWQDIIGQPPVPGQLFSSEGLYHWPIGYHLLLMLGFPFGEGAAGGRAITLIMAVGATALLYLFIVELLRGESLGTRVIAGLVGGAALPLVATYTRYGLSLMADVPALFWGVLGLYCCLRAWPLRNAECGMRNAKYETIQRGDAETRRFIENEESSTQHPVCEINPDKTQRLRVSAFQSFSTQHSALSTQHSWALCGGLALGLATLIRYGSGLLLVPLLVYFALRWYGQRRQSGAEGLWRAAFWWPVLTFALGFAVALLPQLAYILTHHTAGAGYGDWLADWTPANLLRTTVSSGDGTSAFAQPMLVFYLLQPLYDSDGGFLSCFYLPAILVGLATLVYRRRWPVVGLLLSWWIAPVLFFAGTPYQAHRFVLTYLPALLTLLGVGVAATIAFALKAVHGSSSFVRLPVRALALGVAAIVLLGISVGVYWGQASVRNWIATHAAFKVEEEKVVSLARQAAGGYTEQAPPRVVSFGITAALYHYTQWPVIELFNSDEADIARFLAAPGTRLVVLPENNIEEQWAGKPLAARWHWVKAHYVLTPQGRAGNYSVYKVEPQPTP